MKKYINVKTILIFLYIVCIIVLVFEASMPGKVSSQHSNAVGNSVADIINDFKSDQTVVYEPKQVEITNKVSSAYVGDIYKLETKVLPEEATNKSLCFHSSNSEIASISSDGVISFLKEGEVLITVSCSKNGEIKDSILILVSNVLLFSFTTSIDANTSDGVYILYLGREYKINNVLNPVNTTNKLISYEISNPSYLEIENGVITPLKITKENKVQIIVRCGDMVNTLDVFITQENIVELESISFTTDSIYMAQTVKLNININPMDATFSGYKITSLNEDIIKINGDKLIGKNVGKATIRIESTFYPDIYFEKEIEVFPQPELDLEKTNVYLSSNIYVGKTERIKINKYPSYALNAIAIYESGDTSIATVSNTGIVTGVSSGVTTIFVHIKDKTFSLPVTIVEIEDDMTTDFSLSTDEISLFVDEEFNLSEIKVLSWLPKTPVNTKIIYSLPDDCGTINGNILKITKPGTYVMDAIHQASGLKKTIKIEAVYQFNTDVKEDVTIKVGEVFSFDIIDNSLGNQDYYIEISNSDSFSINKEELTIFAIGEGTCDVVIIPIINNQLYYDYQVKFLISSFEVYTENLSYRIFLNNKEIEIKNEQINVYFNDKCRLSVIVDNYITSSKIRFQSSDTSILSFDASGNLVFNSIGDAILTISEYYSGLTKEIKVCIRNYIDFKSDAYTITGVDVSFENDIFTIVNGKSARIKINFKDNSTYRLVQYYCSDDDILEVGNDGVITPKKAGKATINCVIDDGLSERISIDIEISVLRQNYINKTTDLFLKIRKALGHFGAFMVLGIFSTLSWFLIFNKKRIYFSIPISIIVGYLIAVLTEFIQYFVPGRHGNYADVLLDFYGFILTTSIISLFIILKILYNKFRNNRLVIINKEWFIKWKGEI